VVIVGAVRTPSRFEFRENVHLNELIACAGGLTDTAGKYLQIVNYGGPTCSSSGGDVFKLNIHSLAAVLRRDEESNLAVRGGDIIVVLESEPIYVTGYVVRPQPVSSNGPITLTQAMALAGGVTKYGKTDRIRIYRQAVGASDHTVITVDLKAITKRRAVDFVLQPFDVVDVPGRHHGDRLLISGPFEPFKELPIRPIC
jgi:polysaccharide export outer membrane protein